MLGTKHVFRLVIRLRIGRSMRLSMQLYCSPSRARARRLAVESDTNLFCQSVFVVQGRSQTILSDLWRNKLSPLLHRESQGCNLASRRKVTPPFIRLHPLPHTDDRELIKLQLSALRLLKFQFKHTAKTLISRQLLQSNVSNISYHRSFVYAIKINVVYRCGTWTA